VFNLIAVTGLELSKLVDDGNVQLSSPPS
jgi:hypothetical protein